MRVVSLPNCLIKKKTVGNEGKGKVSLTHMEKPVLGRTGILPIHSNVCLENGGRRSRGTEERAVHTLGVTGPKKEPQREGGTPGSAGNVLLLSIDEFCTIEGVPKNKRKAGGTLPPCGWKSGKIEKKRGDYEERKKKMQTGDNLMSSGCLAPVQKKI